MGGKHGNGSRWNLGKILDEDCAFVLQALDHVFVMHDLVTHIDGGTVFLECALDDLDRADHAGAKAAGLSQINFHGTSVVQVVSLSSSVSPRIPSCTPDICNIRTTPVCDPPHVSAWRHKALCQSFTD